MNCVITLAYFFFVSIFNEIMAIIVRKKSTTRGKKEKKEKEKSGKK